MEWIAIIFFGLIIMSVISSKMQDNVRRKYSKTIKKVIIVSNDSRKKATSSAIRGVVGGSILGPAGLIAGAVSGKNKNSTTFLIEYKTGKKETKTVKNDSIEF